ncbi:MAG: MnhB domain-containing protein [Elusimicrobiota bacterium]
MVKIPEHGMTLIVKTITRYTVGLILLFGIYIVLHGHLTPGGGFAGGVIVALSFVHLMLAFGRETAIKKMSEKAAKILEGLGAIMFLLIAFMGLTTGYFFYNFFRRVDTTETLVEYIGRPFALFSAGIIPLCNIAICLKVGAGLFAIFVALTFLKMNGDAAGDGEKK